MPLAVSVVVPVFNPGPYVEACLTSLLRQTLSRDRYEVVLVDDGSTDGTAERLDRVASRHPDLITVIHTESSGWAGRPRNLGTDAAAGDYVFYADCDDWLPPEALEALHDRAVRDDSDIVVGRLVGHRRAVPAAIFDRGDYCTTWRDTPELFSSLTTHKLFRRAFLQERGLRFPEGPVRLEDQIMVTRAYLEARRVSVVGSQPCYVYERRDDLGSLTARPIDPVGYLRSVRAVVGNVLAATEPGPERVTVLTRTLQYEILGRVDGRHYLDQEDAYRAEMFDQVRQTMLDSIDEATDRQLAPVTRVRAALVRAGDRARLERWVAWAGGVSATVELAGVAWEGTQLRVDLRAAFQHGRAPLYLDRAQDRLYLRGPEDVDLQADPRLRDAADVTDHLPRSGVVLLLRSRDYMEEWRVPTAHEPHVEADGAAVRWTATARFDPSTVAAGGPLRPGVWDLVARVQACGFQRDRRLGSRRDKGVEAPLPALVGAGATAVVPLSNGPRDNLAIDVGQWTRSLAAEVAARGVQARPAGDGRTLSLSLPLTMRDGAATAEVLLLPRRRGRDGPRLQPGRVGPGTDGRATLEVPLDGLRRGRRWSVHLRFGEPGTGAMHPVGLLLVRRPSGRFAVRRTATRGP